MIDWWNVAGHAVWIVGAAVLLARFSYRSYEMAEARRSGRASPRSAGPDRLYRLGLLLLSVGLGVSSTAWLERAIWGLLAVMSVVELMLLGPRRSSDSPHGDEQV